MLELLLLPGAEIRLLGQPPELPQTIEDFSCARMRIEPRLGKPPQFDIGAVVEGELPVGAENRNRGREPVQCFGMGVQMTLQFRLGFRRRRDIDCAADDAPGGQWCKREIERAAMTGQNGKALRFHRLVVDPRRAREIAFGPVEGDIHLQGGLWRRRTRCCEERTVDEAEGEILRPSYPDRDRNRIQDRLKFRLLRLSSDLGFKEHDDGAAGWPAADMDGTAVDCPARQDERRAVGCQAHRGRSRGRWRWGRPDTPP